MHLPPFSFKKKEKCARNRTADALYQQNVRAASRTAVPALLCHSPVPQDKIRIFINL